jgi:hypothetical protein
MAGCKHGHFVIPVTDYIPVHNSCSQNNAANLRTCETIGFAYFVIFL